MKTEERSQLRDIRDADESLRNVGHDLLARQRGAAALDHVAAVIDLVGAVDVDRNLLDVIRVEHLDAVGAQPFAALLAARDGAADRLPDAGQRIDEAVDGGAGADADDAVGDDVLESGAPDQCFQLFLGLRW